MRIKNEPKQCRYCYFNPRNTINVLREPSRRSEVCRRNRSQLVYCKNREKKYPYVVKLAQIYHEIRKVNAIERFLRERTGKTNENL